MNLKSENAPAYLAQEYSEEEQDTIHAALTILRQRMQRKEAFASPGDVRQFLVLKLAELEHEVFGTIWLDSQHGLLGHEEMFRGTIDGASVYPREIVKRALQLNAAAVVFYHNHPSTVPEPSQADQRLTQRLKAALGTVDIRVLDHFVVGGTSCVSFAELGLL